LAKLANEKNIPVLVDAETEVSDLPAFKGILEYCDFIKCGENFPISYTKKDDLLDAMKYLLDLPHKRFVCCTLGARGSILLQRSTNREAYPVISTFSELLDIIQENVNEKTLHFSYIPKHTSCLPCVIEYCPAYKKVSIIDTTGT
jgi:hypothetical protein